MRSCEVCGGACKGSAKRFCSFACRDARAKKVNPTRRFALRCQTCGVDFIGTDARMRYCGSRCRGFAAKDSVEGFLRHLLKHRQRSKTLGLAFLSQMYESQAGRCAVSGLEMTRVFGRGRVYTNISIDRIDSSIGYEPGNVRLVCLAVNLMKLEMDDCEFSQWVGLINDGFKASRQRAA